MEKKIPYSRTPEARKAYYERRVAQGLCPQCGSEHAEGRKCCLNCLDAISVRNIGRYDRMSDEQRRKYIHQRSEGVKAARERYKAAGLCVVCGKVEPLPGVLYCAKCKARSNANCRKQYERRKRMKMEGKDQ